MVAGPARPAHFQARKDPPMSGTTATRAGVGVQGTAAPYLERLAKTHRVHAAGYAEGLPEDLAHPLNGCGNTATVGECSCDERWLKIEVCGREWCRRCGQKRSEAHMRRYARWVRRLRTVDVAGYWVVTFPPAMRQALRDPEELRRVGKVVARVFRAQGFDRGLRRWHFFGDGGRAGHTSEIGTYHPHLNVLTGGSGLLDLQRLEAVKTALREALGVPEAVIHYSYRRGPAALCHVARYITRPTFRDATWDIGLAQDLHNFRNDAWWGDWSGDPLWDLTQEQDGVAAVADLEAGTCPDCYEKVRWTGDVVDVRTIAHGTLRIVGGGYARLLSVPPG